jgi:putative PIN family toxin of toxin-antitoxin system
MDMYFSDEILTEVERVMGYGKLPITEETADLFLTIMRGEGAQVEPDVSVDASEDPGDNRFLKCALEADARYLVSGDSDLLDLNEFRGVDIVDASGFLEYRTKFN